MSRLEQSYALREADCDTLLTVRTPDGSGIGLEDTRRPSSAGGADRNWATWFLAAGGAGGGLAGCLVIICTGRESSGAQQICGGSAGALSGAQPSRHAPTPVSKPLQRHARYPNSGWLTPFRERRIGEA
jgi:hypothetical protein